MTLPPADAEFLLRVFAGDPAVAALVAAPDAALLAELCADAVLFLGLAPDGSLNPLGEALTAVAVRLAGSASLQPPVS